MSDRENLKIQISLDETKQESDNAPESPTKPPDHGIQVSKVKGPKNSYPQNWYSDLVEDASSLYSMISWFCSDDDCKAGGYGDTVGDGEAPREDMGHAISQDNISMRSEDDPAGKHNGVKDETTSDHINRNQIKDTCENVNKSELVHMIDQNIPPPSPTTEADVTMGELTSRCTGLHEIGVDALETDAVHVKNLAIQAWLSSPPSDEDSDSADDFESVGSKIKQLEGAIAEAKKVVENCGSDTSPTKGVLTTDIFTETDLLEPPGTADSESQCSVSEVKRVTFELCDTPSQEVFTAEISTDTDLDFEQLAIIETESQCSIKVDQAISQDELSATYEEAIASDSEIKYHHKVGLGTCKSDAFIGMQESEFDSSYDGMGLTTEDDECYDNGGYTLDDVCELVPVITVEVVHSEKESISQREIPCSTGTPVVKISDSQNGNNIDVAEDAKAPTKSTNEHELGLKNDLKELDNIVKSLYKNLNKSGGFTVVANYDPRVANEVAVNLSPSSIEKYDVYTTYDREPIDPPALGVEENVANSYHFDPDAPPRVLRPLANVNERQYRTESFVGMAHIIAKNDVPQPAQRNIVTIPSRHIIDSGNEKTISDKAEVHEMSRLVQDDHHARQVPSFREPMRNNYSPGSPSQQGCKQRHKSPLQQSGNVDKRRHPTSSLPQMQTPVTVKIPVLASSAHSICIGSNPASDESDTENGSNPVQQYRPAARPYYPSVKTPDESIRKQSVSTFELRNSTPTGKNKIKYGYTRHDASINRTPLSEEAFMMNPASFRKPRPGFHRIPSHIPPHQHSYQSQGPNIPPYELRTNPTGHHDAPTFKHSLNSSASSIVTVLESNISDSGWESKSSHYVEGYKTTTDRSLSSINANSSRGKISVPRFDSYTVMVKENQKFPMSNPNRETLDKTELGHIHY